VLSEVKDLDVSLAIDDFSVLAADLDAQSRMQVQV